MNTATDRLSDPDATANHRQVEILDALRRAGGAARIQSLANALDVSDETIRRNIRRLAAEGLVEKLHGGARLVERVDEADLQTRLQENIPGKRRIAGCVAAMVADGASVFLDVGSTTSFIADALQAHSRLNVFTNSLAVAWKLATRNANRVFFAGGELRPADGGTFGPEALEFLDYFTADLAIISATGLCPDRGFLLADLSEARLARKMMTRAARVIVAADSRKFHRLAPVSLGDPAQVDMLVCDAPPPEVIRLAAEGWGVDICVAA
ncbi:MAG: DeoR/GlpR transcriptional regulator [Rhodobacteraceae bacterium]|jgi:DeoR family glycerol-3-phosphate regulon repressor|nr:DeoR/GlpR transcriptional regulator [Paracoccaceae bacterium]